MPDVILLTKYDCANSGWRFKRCLEHLGLDRHGSTRVGELEALGVQFEAAEQVPHSRIQS